MIFTHFFVLGSLHCELHELQVRSIFLFCLRFLKFELSFIMVICCGISFSFWFDLIVFSNFWVYWFACFFLKNIIGGDDFFCFLDWIINFFCYLNFVKLNLLNGFILIFYFYLFVFYVMDLNCFSCGDWGCCVELGLYSLFFSSYFFI